MAPRASGRWWFPDFLVTALIAPGTLRPLNRLWFRVGLLLHRIVNPVILGGLFFLVVTPTAIVMRLCGKRPLQLDFEPKATTYWIERDPPGPDPKTMGNQF